MLHHCSIQDGLKRREIEFGTWRCYVMQHPAGGTFRDVRHHCTGSFWACYSCISCQEFGHICREYIPGCLFTHPQITFAYFEALSCFLFSDKVKWQPTSWLKCSQVTLLPGLLITQLKGWSEKMYASLPGSDVCVWQWQCSHGYWRRVISMLPRCLLVLRGYGKGGHSTSRCSEPWRKEN